MEKNKVFLGAWIDRSVKKRLKVICVQNDVNQEDIVEQLIINWLERPDIKG